MEEGLVTIAQARHVILVAPVDYCETCRSKPEWRGI
jgi:hypothetical protein